VYWGAEAVRNVVLFRHVLTVTNLLLVTVMAPISLVD
jgi:hypothetical protein